MTRAGFTAHTLARTLQVGLTCELPTLSAMSDAEVKERAAEQFQA